MKNTEVQVIRDRSQEQYSDERCYQVIVNGQHVGTVRKDGYDWTASKSGHSDEQTDIRRFVSGHGRANTKKAMVDYLVGQSTFEVRPVTVEIVRPVR